jgi:hypothetical protein
MTKLKLKPKVVTPRWIKERRRRERKFQKLLAQFPGSPRTMMFVRDRRSIGRWLKLQANLRHATDERDRAEKRLRTHVERHLQRHPLSEEQKQALVAVVRDGGQLCCDDGRETLYRLVDSIWTNELNGWAYEALACHRGSDDDRDHWLAKLRAKIGVKT